jgi:hypothetical protein
MNELLLMLSGGDLRSDGPSDLVAEIVLANPGLLPDLMEGPKASDEVIRGRAADCLEKVSRSKPEIFRPYVDQLLIAARGEYLPMARWHYAMIFGNLAVFEDQIEKLVGALDELLGDESVFVKSWTISSLTIFARLYPLYNPDITASIQVYQDDESIAIRTRVRKSIECLLNSSRPLPKGWVKSETLLEKFPQLA